MKYYATYLVNAKIATHDKIIILILIGLFLFNNIHYKDISQKTKITFYSSILMNLRK